MTLTLHGPVAERIQGQVSEGNYQSPEDLIEEALEALVRQRVNAGIVQGLADVTAGRCRRLTKENVGEIARSIVRESLP
uniref:Antitoxin ParD n=1 Tax=Candidatus Kentrum sp. DK TaxID=2126562 RepID=A0A450TKH4_9GAMM|nr:MAG: hypothetical protein BECKDK2373B_GA0170837_12065 [Candidatus Kentron sp. DK]